MSLTAIAIKNAKSRAKSYKLTDCDGLYLLVTPAGARYWRMNYRHLGKQKTLAFGVWPDTGLAEAREQPVRADIPVYVEISDHTALDELRFRKLSRQPNTLGLVELARDRELDLACELRVDPLLGRFDGIPQLFTVGEMLGRAIRQHHVGVNHAGLVREVVMPVDPLVVQQRGRAIGRGSNRARTAGARNDLG